MNYRDQSQQTFQVLVAILISTICKKKKQTTKSFQRFSYSILTVDGHIFLTTEKNKGNKTTGKTHPLAVADTATYSSPSQSQILAIILAPLLFTDRQLQGSSHTPTQGSNQWPKGISQISLFFGNISNSPLVRHRESQHNRSITTFVEPIPQPVQLADLIIG